MEGAGYQKLIADVLFWHSVQFSDQGFAIGMRDKPVTLEDIRGKRRTYRLCEARRDLIFMLRQRDPRIFSLNRIGRIVNRQYSTVLVYMRPKNRYPYTYKPQGKRVRRHFPQGSYVDQLPL